METGEDLTRDKKKTKCAIFVTYETVITTRIDCVYF
jgi:hypothetical protein